MIPRVANRQPPLHRLQKGPGFRAGAKNRKHLQMRMKMAFRNRSWAQAFGDMDHPWLPECLASTKISQTGWACARRVVGRLSGGCVQESAHL